MKVACTVLNRRYLLNLNYQSSHTTKLINSSFFANLNSLRIGVIYGLFVDAFKLGS